MPEDFLPVARLDEIEDPGVLQVKVDGELVGLYRVGQEVYALNDVCTHEEAYLSEGYFDPDELEVECPLHGSAFRLSDGSVHILPATRPETTYHVKIEGDEILVGPPKDNPPS